MFGAIVLGWFLTVGYIPQHTVGTLGATPSTEFVYQQTGLNFEATLGVDAIAFNHFTAGGSVRTYERYDNAASFLPYSADYMVYGGIRLGALTLTVSHECDHPVVSMMDGSLSWPIGQNITEVSLTIRGETK